jgi:hypothetical protein
MAIQTEAHRLRTRFANLILARQRKSENKEYSFLGTEPETNKGVTDRDVL